MADYEPVHPGANYGPARRISPPPADKELEKLLAADAPYAADFNDKVSFSSGATAGGKRPRYQLLTFTGVDATAERFEYGNQKHENGQTILADANWLKAFHARDLKFFQDRINHGITHMFNESQGRFEPTLGGNWGAVGWCVEVLTFVQKYDPIFYLAVVGRTAHPGERKEDCACPRCGL